MEKNNDFFIRSTFRTYLIPSILALLGTTITVLIDSTIIGNFLGEKGLAVYIGKEDQKSCDNMASLALILSVAAGLMVTIPGLIFLPAIVGGLGGTYSRREMECWQMTALVFGLL